MGIEGQNEYAQALRSQAKLTQRHGAKRAVASAHGGESPWGARHGAGLALGLIANGWQRRLSIVEKLWQREDSVDVDAVVANKQHKSECVRLCVWVSGNVQK